jgi:DNA-binding transcriptional MerR regulator
MVISMNQSVKNKSIQSPARGREPASAVPGRTSGALRIGDLARSTDVTVEALRYYERLGLLWPSGRRESGYREYSPDAVRLVRFIKRAQALGFTLAEVEELVRLRERDWEGDAARLLRDATVAKLRDIDRRMAELSDLREELSALIATCDAACPVPVGTPSGNGDTESCAGDTECAPVTPPDCPLVEALDTADGPTEADCSTMNNAGDPPTPGRRDRSFGGSRRTPHPHGGRNGRH